MPFNQLKFKGMAFVFYDRIVIYSKMKKNHSVSDVSSTEITFSGRYLKSILEMD